MSVNGKRSMLRLTERMMESFFSGLSLSSARCWKKLHIVSLSPETQMMTRKNLDDPAEPTGVILSACTSIWLPVKKARVFEFLCSLEHRLVWDVLCKAGDMEEMLRIPKGEPQENCIKIIRGGVTLTFFVHKIPK